MLIDFIAEGFDGAFYFLARHNRKIKYKDTIFLLNRCEFLVLVCRCSICFNACSAENFLGFQRKHQGK